MATRIVSESHSAILPGTTNIFYTTRSFDMESESSPRVDGKLRLRANPFSLSSYKCSASVVPDSEGFNPTPYPQYDYFTTNDDWVSALRSSAANAARASFIRRIKQGNSASLGVSLSQWRQSRDMIVSRANSLSKLLDIASVKLENRREKGRLRYYGTSRVRNIRVPRRNKESLAGAVLEGFFGWAPLVGDITGSLAVLANPIPPTWVSVAPTKTGGARKVSKDWNGDTVGWGQANASVRCSVSGKIIVTNPNLWMLNQLGLLNPGQVAWDLVPWSFLVNAFANVNQLLGSVSDLAGVTLADTSTTFTTNLSFNMQSILPVYHPDGNYTSGNCSVRWKTKARSVGVIPDASLEFRIPELNWESAAIASSLLLQKAKRISRILSL